MKFSIIIAAYNLGHLICDAIESCIDQEKIAKNEYEIITINDGSTDNTLEYINKYLHIENHTIIDKPNGGLSQTRNYGIEIAKGEYLLFLDGDDWLAKDALSTLSKYIDSYDVIVYPMLYYYTDSEQIMKLFLPQGEYTNKEFIHETIGKNLYNVIPAQKKIYRRDFILENNIRFVEGILHEDNPFIVDVLSVCTRLYYIDSPIYFYRQNREGSITSQCTIKNFYGTLKGIDKIKTTPLRNNKDIQILIVDLLIYQAIGNYKSKEEKKEVFTYFREISTKKYLFKLLPSVIHKYKTFIKALCLIIDPVFLKPFTL